VEWEGDLETPPNALGEWRDFDVTAAMVEPVRTLAGPACNDATSACAAELTFARGEPTGTSAISMSYFHRRAASCSMAACSRPQRQCRGARFDADHAPQREWQGEPSAADPRSLHLPAGASLIAAGRRGSDIWLSPDDWSSFEQPLEIWIAEAAEALAQAIAALLAVIDFEAIIIEGAFPARCASTARRADH